MLLWWMDLKRLVVQLNKRITKNAGVFFYFYVIAPNHRSLQILASNIRSEYDLLKYSKSAAEESIFLFH